MGGSRRRIVDEKDATALLDAWQDSGMELRGFCESRDVDGRSLRYWAGRLGRDQPFAATSGVRLVELTVPAPAVRPTYRLVVGDIVIELDDTFRNDTLLRLLDLVAPC
jgi:hypothetical protein